MRQLTLTNTGPQLTRFDFYRLELDMGAPVPEDYREFLITANGGFPEPELAFKWRLESRRLNAFWQLLPDANQGIRNKLRYMREMRADGILPIGGSADSDIGLLFKDKSHGVVFVEYIYRDDFPIGAKAYPLAESFTAFLNSLIVLPLDPIVELAKHGTPEELAKYLEKGHSIDELSKHKLSLLCEAIKFRNRALIEACLERKANLTKAMFIAVQNRQLEIITRLVAAGADVNEIDEYGETPLHYVGGQALPGEEGQRNRELEALMLSLGAHK